MKWNVKNQTKILSVTPSTAHVYYLVKRITFKDKHR